MKWRIIYNRHRYGDLSDPARHAVHYLTADNRDQAESLVYQWREAVGDGPYSRSGSGQKEHYIGIVHFNSLEPAESERAA